MFQKKKNIVLLILLNLFFAQFAMVFWGFLKYSVLTEYILLLSVPCCFIAFRRDELKLKVQMLSLALLFLGIWIAGIRCVYTPKIRIPLIAFGGICLLAGTMIGLFFSWKELLARVSIKKYIGVIVVCVLFIVLSLETVTEVPILDNGAYYAWSIRHQDAIFDFSVITIAVGGMLAQHTAIGYALFTLLGELLWPGAIGVHFINIALAVLSIAAFYLILREQFPSKNESVRTLATAVYAFSPYLLGLVGNTNVDVASIYFLVIMLYCNIKNYWLLELFFSWVFVCTKEPSAVYFAFFLLGTLFYNFGASIWKRRQGVWKEVFVWAIPRGLLLFWWLLCFFQSSLVEWVTTNESGVFGDGSHRLGFSGDNLIGKAQQIWLMNFNWIFVLAVLGGGIFLVVRRKQTQIGKVLIPLLVTFTGFFIFQNLYLDYLHPRYIALGAVIFAIIGILILLETLGSKGSNVCFAGLALIMLVQSFVSVDPVTKKMFADETNHFSDHYIYNREYSYYYKAVSKAMAKAGFDKGSVLVFSGFENVPGAYGYSDIMFWNMAEGRLEAGWTEDNIALVIGKSVEELHEYEKVVYIVPFYATEDQVILQEMDIEDMFEVNYRTRSVKCYVGST